MRGSSTLVHLDSICRGDSIRKTSTLGALNGVLHVISQPSESHSETLKECREMLV